MIAHLETTQQSRSTNQCLIHPFTYREPDSHSASPLCTRHAKHTERFPRFAARSSRTSLTVILPLEHPDPVSVNLPYFSPGLAYYPSTCSPSQNQKDATYARSKMPFLGFLEWGPRSSTSFFPSCPRSTLLTNPKRQQEFCRLYLLNCFHPRPCPRPRCLAHESSQQSPR